jgi:N6-adenosine-specific RNA methylase IME4
MPTPEERNRPESVFQVPHQGHSEKPDVVYDMIAKMYPNRKYLELFARKKRAGWIVWRNEIEIIYQPFHYLLILNLVLSFIVIFIAR